MREYLKTSDVCKVLSVSSRTAAKLFDSGRLSGFCPTPGADRRYSVSSLRAYIGEICNNGEIEKALIKKLEAVASE